ncbi:MAG: DUF3499 family protein [Actinomycetota bacterium]
MRLCSKPRCATTGVAVLSYDYSTKRALIGDAPAGDLSPHLYVLCERCANAITPPQGWSLEDQRGPRPLFASR